MLILLMVVLILLFGGGGGYYYGRGAGWGGPHYGGRLLGLVLISPRPGGRGEQTDWRGSNQKKPRTLVCRRGVAMAWSAAMNSDK